MVRAQRYSYILASFFGFAIVLLGTFYKSHRYWLQDCGLLITLAALGIRWAPAVRVMLRLRSMSRSLQRVCSASGVHFGFVNTTYQWLCVFLPTALFLSIICLIADIALRTGHVLLQSGSLVFEIVFVLIVLLFPRVSKVGSLLQRLEAAVYSARRPGSPPKAAKFILLLVPRRHREHLIGDLEEEYSTIVLPEYGTKKAQRWYWWHVAITVGPVMWAQIRRVAAMAWLWKHLR